MINLGDYTYYKPPIRFGMENGGNMKKFLLFSALAVGFFSVVPNAVMADKQTCQIRENDTCDNDNEYLSIDGVRGCYVCESKKCVTGDLVVATNARLDGKQYRNYKFRCQLGWDDQWIASPIPQCSERWRIVRGDMHAREKIINPDTGEPMFNDNSSQVVTGADPCIAWICDKGYVEQNGKCVPEGTTPPANPSTPNAGKPQAQLDCEAEAARGEPANWNGNACNCGDKHTWNAAQKKCIAKASGGNGEGTTSSCITRRCKNLTGAQKAECAVCCAVPASVAKWNGSACACVDTSKKFDVATGVCNAQDATPPTVVVPDPVNTFNCDATKLAELAKWRVQYRAQTEIVALIDIILAYCQDANRNEIVFNGYYNEILAAIAQIDAAAAAATTAQQQQAEINIRIRRIRNATSNIQTMADAFKVSKWKNEEGNFNTSRLVSDSVAGVVLGTAGGLITSNVIKKNQVKGGFEDISCTIGGQVVAGWKDEFRVGIH